MKAPRPLIALAIAASLLASGCYCPMLSGRYNEIGCCPPRLQRGCPSEAYQPATPDCPQQNTDCPPASTACDCPGSIFPAHHCCFLSRWLVGFGKGGVPSQQHPDYYSPPGKFHPIPTRPAFELLPTYPPLQPADAGLNNPLRASTTPPTAPLSR